MHAFFEVIQVTLGYSKWIVLDFPNLSPCNLPTEFGNPTKIKILSDSLILIWGHFGCNVHNTCTGLLQDKMPFAICVIRQCTIFFFKFLNNPYPRICFFFIGRERERNIDMKEKH